MTTLGNTNRKKILYFEGAGSATPETIATGVGNCRIRTAFHTRDGQAVFLEVMSGFGGKQNGLHGVVDFAFYITDDKDDCNESRIPSVDRTFPEYTPSGILDVVRQCGGDFDAIVVLPFLSGYFVHKENRCTSGRNDYNYGDAFIFDAKLTAWREEIKKECYRLEYEAREKDKKEQANQWVHSPGGGIWPNFSLWVPDDRPDTLCWHLCDSRVAGTHEIDTSRSSVRECIKQAMGWTDETYGDFDKARLAS